MRRQFSDRNIEEFNQLLEMESLEDVFIHDDVNTSYIIFLYCFERAFPLKTGYKKKL
jgi:hypothetical protein